MYNFDVFYNTYYRYFCGMVDNKIKCEDPSEITQIAFCRLSVCKYILNDAMAKKFMRTTINNLCIDFLRRQQERKPKIKELQKHLKTQASFDTYTSDEDWEEIKNNVLQYIHEKIEELPSATKKVFKLFYYNNKSVPEIAYELNVSTQTVHNQLQHARDMIKIELLFKQKMKLF